MPTTMALSTPQHLLTASPQAHADRVSQPVPPAALRQWSSAVLLAGASEVEIVHGAMVYRLRHTSLGKLILTK